MDAATPSPLQLSQDFQHRLVHTDLPKNADNVFKFLDHEKASQEKLRVLEDDLKVYKLALSALQIDCFKAQAECARLRETQDEAFEENQRLRDSMKAHRVMTLIDGDGAIFSKDLIRQGQQGGDRAARQLSDSIGGFLSSNYGPQSYQLWVYLFYNKRGLTETFNRAGLAHLNDWFEDFVVGFNQANERFTMMDVGIMKEAADVKIRGWSSLVHLQDDIQLPQTFKVIFGGCHDGGYVGSLRSQITAGFRDKLILLKGYTQMANAISGLDLPVIDSGDLFMPQKLSTVNRWTTISQSPSQIATDADTMPDDSSKVSNPESDELDGAGVSYSQVLQRAAAAPSSRENLRERSSSIETSWSTSSTPPTRRPNPNLILDKQPPCSLFYLANCKHGTKCKYAHDYDLTEDHLQEMRTNSRLGPCPLLNRGEICLWDDCIYGHSCPQSTRCPFHRLGICKFKGGMRVPSPPLTLSQWRHNLERPANSSGVIHPLYSSTILCLSALGSATLKNNALLEVQVRELEFEVQILRARAREGQDRLASSPHNIPVSNTFVNQSPLILCIINGDEKLFTSFVQGQDGGHATAGSLTQQIANYLGPEGLHNCGEISFWITVYFNRCLLLDRLVANNICTVQQFDGFLAGFNQRSRRFSFIDVGYSNETDPRIIDCINLYARFPQTYRVFLAGGCGPQYTSFWQNLEANLRGKLVFVGSDDAEAPATFPFLNVGENIFMNPKTQHHPSPAPLNMRSAIGNGGLISPQSPASQISRRAIDPTLPLHKQNPPPCNEYYLMTCSKGPAVCKYSHEYILTPEQLASLSTNAKKAPCNHLKNGTSLLQLSECCWGHVCPNGLNCFHLSKGKCWFKGGRFLSII
ncbi:hypothetical protein R3P38DRAFT_2495455 [Favolaschia claudopus]|uniref:C3H1-type domain-containing protein n=1 Tax=Favolaschia claudopus TaxID=2862362 RepID=A0AAW0E874_9AGAR